MKNLKQVRMSRDGLLVGLNPLQLAFPRIAPVLRPDDFQRDDPPVEATGAPDLAEPAFRAEVQQFIIAVSFLLRIHSRPFSR